ncbi:MAG: nitrogen regulation protein NR(II) [Wenzhouxiangellaceae bacterium]|nr:nitrogen regulation protein NR(II) [Wenzhouxiangellaceae bacterium]
MKKSQAASKTADSAAPSWLGAMQTALVLVEPSGAIARLNPAAEDLMASRSSDDAGFEHVLSASGLLELCRRADEEGRPVASQDLPWTLQGAARWLDARAARLPGGEVLLELQDAEPRRRAMHDRSRRARRALSHQVIRQLAHEVRNPLAGLRGAAQVLDRRDLDSEGRELVDIVRDQVDRLDALVGQLLGHGRTLEFATGNVHAPIDAARALLEAEAGGRCRFERDYDPSLPTLRLDENALQQVVLNLGRNALQAGARCVALRTRAWTGTSVHGAPCRLAVSLEVEDDGPGVPDELLDSLFFPLVTSRPDGTGLGLSIAQEIVERHAGEIDHERRQARTVFRVLLPVARPERRHD